MKMKRKDDDALVQSWHTRARRGWLNPPYSRTFLKAFIRKAAAERLHGFTTVMLVPARTDTRAFHDHIYDHTQWSARPERPTQTKPLRTGISGPL